MESNCLLMKIHRFYLVLLPYSANNSDTDDYHPNTTKSTKNNTFKHYHQAKNLRISSIHHAWPLIFINLSKINYLYLV